ncbi:phosphotransferase [Micromonospora sp. WMMD1102]|uniref:phosphotransferase n=1 Tax=Micromonospora sp. WMMD1102 TaxID=3016105 RepID=UPI0024155689|nr:phosphotransferase [Micromonospora sp. WMMD1102]MDG4787154.1 phosphotransferase [Micromonospora sp. WMMD1102]
MERLYLGGQRTRILKYTRPRPPFPGEDRALALAAARGVPVPRMEAATVRNGVLGILLEDLGGTLRAARPVDGATVVARLHKGGPAHGLPVLDRPTLAALPGRALTLVDHLRHRDRLDNHAILHRALNALVAVAARRACGADIPPFGVCHGQLHPSAVHIGSRGARLLDLAMAHNGPGLLDIASWVGAGRPPNTHAMGHLIGLYRALAGIPEADTNRGGLPASVWALGWQRMHAAVCHLHQAVNGDSDERAVRADVEAATRHIVSAAVLLAK